MNEKVCCISGKRDIPPESEERIRKELFEKIIDAINNGHNIFICGFARGTDIMAAEIIIKLKGYKENENIKLKAYLPYKERKCSKKIKELLNECDDIIPCSEYYYKGCYLVRDKKMIENSGMLIAVTGKEETGGTGYTIRCAVKKDIDIERIWL